MGIRPRVCSFDKGSVRAVLLQLQAFDYHPDACFGPWSAQSCQHDAGSMQFRCAHLIGVLDVNLQPSRPRHHRNHVPGGPRRPAVSWETAGNAIFYSTCGTSRSDQKSTPLTHILCRMTLIRLAKATKARLPLRRRATCAAHVLNHVERPRCIMTVAA